MKVKLMLVYNIHITSLLHTTYDIHICALYTFITQNKNFLHLDKSSKKAQIHIRVRESKTIVQFIA